MSILKSYRMMCDECGRELAHAPSLAKAREMAFNWDLALQVGIGDDFCPDCVAAFGSELRGDALDDRTGLK